MLTWLKAGNRKHKDWDNTTLGTLRLDNGSRLVIEVNSARTTGADCEGDLDAIRVDGDARRDDDRRHRQGTSGPVRARRRNR